MHIPALISDLAVMLITAGIITIIFRKAKQPLVLGYILAGFLISSYFPFFPTVVDTENISTLSEIGIIFLSPQAGQRRKYSNYNCHSRSGRHIGNGLRSRQIDGILYHG